MIEAIKRIVIVVVAYLCLVPLSVKASHNANRYFPFLERPEAYLYKKHGRADINVFQGVARRALNNKGGGKGIPELWGTYDLYDVMNALEKTGNSMTSSLRKVLGKDLALQKLPFRVSQSLYSRGVTFSYTYGLPYHITCGFWVPFMYVHGVHRYSFDVNLYRTANDFSQAREVPDDVVDHVDAVRRKVHQAINFGSNAWTDVGPGDVDLFIGWSHEIYRKYLLRSASLNVRAGALIPTGRVRSRSYPASVSFMNDGHWGCYLDFVPEFELKEDLKVGLMLGANFLFEQGKTTQLPVFKEPLYISPLVARIVEKPGDTLKFSPYVIFENIADGFHVQGRYTYLRHAPHRYCDDRGETTQESYLMNRTNEGNKNMTEKEQLSKFRSHFITVELTYDSTVMKKWVFTPRFYVNIDYLWWGRGAAKSYGVSFGSQVHF